MPSQTRKNDLPGTLNGPGYAPTRLKYNAEKEFRDSTGCMKLQGAMVRRASGAEMSIGSLEACPARTAVVG